MSSSLLCPPMRTVYPCISLNLPWSNSVCWWRDPRTLLHCGQGQPVQPRGTWGATSQAGPWECRDLRLLSPQAWFYVIFKSGSLDNLTSPSSISHLTPQLLMHYSFTVVIPLKGSGVVAVQDSTFFFFFIFSSSLLICDFAILTFSKDFQLRIMDY